MTWTNNGWIHYGGEQNQRSEPRLQASLQELAAVNPDWGQQTTQPVWEPIKTNAEEEQSRRELTAAFAHQQQRGLMLAAKGSVEEQDLRRVLNAHGRGPASAEELDQWLTEAGFLHAEQRTQLAMLLELLGVKLPSSRVAEASKKHTLGTLGIRKATQMTQAQFAQRLRERGVPEDEHLALQYQAHVAGHLISEEEAERLKAMTFHPSAVAKERAKTVRAIHAGIRQVRVLLDMPTSVRVPDIHAAAATPAKGLTLTLQGRYTDWG